MNDKSQIKSEYNIFHFATSELSHSAFFAWLIKQIDPQSDYSLEVREQGLELVNECLKTYHLERINGLEDIDLVEVEREVKRENSKIDITAFIRTKSGRKIGIIIENKVGAQESRKNQLLDYYKNGENIIKEHFKANDAEKVFIYLKSDYDYDDPLVRQDSEGKLSPTRFEKINWKDLYHLFEKRTDSQDSILRSYALWIKEKHDSIQEKLNKPIEHLLSEKINNQIEQERLIKEIFEKTFSDKKTPSWSKKDRHGYLFYYYGPELFLKLGISRGGGRWTELWFEDEKKSLNYFYRIEAGKSFIYAKLGCWERDSVVREKAELKKKELRDKYISLIENRIKSDRDNSSSKPTYATIIGAFNFQGKSIKDLRKIEEVHFDFLKIFRETIKNYK